MLNITSFFQNVTFCSHFPFSFYDSDRGKNSHFFTAVESLPDDLTGVCDYHKSFWICSGNQLFQTHDLLLPDHAEQHGFFLTGIHTPGRNPCKAPLQFFHETLCKLVVQVCNNKRNLGELHTFQKSVRHLCCDKYGDYRIERPL